MEIVSNPYLVQKRAFEWKKDSTIAFVPTMGCLHEGHLSLIHKAKQHGGKVIVSIFVNPLQFGPSEDIDRYPRPYEEDCRKLTEAGVDLLFHPEIGDFYPKGFRSLVTVRGLSDHLCGKSRPGHFEGVATVCLKLFQVTQADVAIFGEKDFQQLAVIQRMVGDFNLPTVIASHPTVREADGLALSSRNRYLSESERATAATIPQSLFHAQKLALERPSLSISDLRGAALGPILQTGMALDYLEVASSTDLTPVGDQASLISVPWPRLFIAAKVGTTRLIDNVPLHPEDPK